MRYYLPQLALGQGIITSNEHNLLDKLSRS